ncbi:MAG: hypothetical protein AAGL66_18880 [Pseudomonadota bacterium]
MKELVEGLLGYLEVKRIDTYLFTGSSPERPRRIFGGQVLAQSLNAANRSIDGGRVAHIQGLYLRPAGQFAGECGQALFIAGGQHQLTAGLRHRDGK